MKLIHCPACGDVVGLTVDTWRQCLCGASGGQYNLDQVTATIGGMAQPFGIDNAFLERTDGKPPEVRQGTNCWWGEYPGDVQILRIESAEGPRLEVLVRPVREDGHNEVWVVDGRPFTVM